MSSEFVNYEAVRALSDGELVRSFKEDGMPAELHVALAGEMVERFCRLHPCTCEWADDEGHLESGPSPYISEADPECPRHGDIYKATEGFGYMSPPEEGE